MLEFNITPEQEKLRLEARRFAIREILPIAWVYDKRDETPLQLIRKSFDAGFINTNIPREYGGKGYGLLEAALMTEEFAAACPGLATSIFDNSLGLEPVILSENSPLKTKYLTEIAKEFKLICFATSEPTMGSDVSGIQCLAQEQDDHYILNGTKYWITNAGLADYMVIFATVDPKSSHEGICAFLVEKEWEGVRVGRPIPKMGQRCSNTAGINLKDVKVPKENMLAPPGEGFVMAMRTFSRTRSVIGAFATGAARAAMEYALDYSKKRHVFGSKISNFQAVQFKLAEMYQKVETARLLTWKGAWEADNGMDPTVTASMAKFYASEIALEVVNEALQIFGGYGYTNMFPVEKLHRDIRLLRIYEGTSEIQRMIVAGHMLGSYEAAAPPLEDLPIHREKAFERGQENAWRCRMCGYVHYGENPPEECPYCFFPSNTFKKIGP
jgi:acyl-CoA dehydrogenase